MRPELIRLAKAILLVTVFCLALPVHADDSVDVKAVRTKLAEEQRAAADARLEKETAQKNYDSASAALAASPGNNDSKRKLDDAEYALKMADYKLGSATKAVERAQKKLDDAFGSTARVPETAAPAERPAVDTAAVQKAAAEKVAAEKVAAEKVAAEKVAAEKVAAEKVAAEKVAAEKVAAEKVAAEKVAAEKVAAEKVAAEKVAAEKVAAEKVAAEKVAAEKVAAEKVAAEKVAAEKVAAEKVAAEKVAAEKVAAEKVAAEKVAAEKVAAEKVAAEAAAKRKSTEASTQQGNCLALPSAPTSPSATASPTEKSYAQGFVNQLNQLVAKKAADDVAPINPAPVLEGTRLNPCDAGQREALHFAYLGNGQYRLETPVLAGQQTFTVANVVTLERAIPDEDNGETYVFFLDGREGRAKLSAYKKSLLEPAAQ